jgi:Sulfotransferase domain
MFRVSSLPILATIPRSGTWFLRYAISFLCHIDRGGHIADRLTGRVFGDPSGPAFDLQSFRGGPLFWVRGTLPDDRLFIGHTVCPGFAASDVDWWQATPFHVPGYDYFHEGMNYRYTPTDLAEYRYTPVRVRTMERCARRGRGRPIVLVYRNPVDQAVSYFRYSQNHKDMAYNSVGGRPLAAIALRDYLLDSALPSYAKQFISFQALSERYPSQVRLVPYERLMAQPVNVLAGILDHLSGAPRLWPSLGDAVWLARREHMKAVEKELGRSLDGTRIDRGSHISQVSPGRAGTGIDERTRAEALAFLDRLGVDTGLFDWPLAEQAATVAA